MARYLGYSRSDYLDMTFDEFNFVFDTLIDILKRERPKE